ncbi:uncharacterized protein K452DRAFT_292338 [Aplosporella prunicola CBS 121167]|uniref:Methyltransferase domain-containing protein n=1 Tax=Aplosporella prunicola CBS 121167 TaxID=1176127 RepID=A0A6A6AXL0_9PEZI|nr:uncharacterized protein K452DRAFT_292338 [Aplosporella prunicola CBS 121167]KAF2136490.1 hypothetical protein K452DRAFT_292338 [Aplosporella prunicola CBS 121167]
MAENPTTTTTPAATAVPLDVDPDFLRHSDSDTDSAVGSIDEQLSSFSTSLTSSITNYPVRNGRRYHAYKDGSYILPNDDEEQDRLDLAHHMMLKLIGDRLFLAPLPDDFAGKILDVGTGTGIWAIEMGDRFPSAEILGNDLSPVQPTWVPTNVKFEVDDVENEWTFPTPFDYVFSRYLASAIGDWPNLVKQAYKNVKPGGWVEFQDFDSMFYSDDGSLTPDHAIHKWISTLVEACGKLGRYSLPGHKLPEWFKEAGFVNIHHEKFKLPIGPWAKEKRQKEAGLLNLMQVIDGLEGFSLRVFVDILKWDIKEVQVLLAQVRQDLKDKSIHAMFDFHVVWAQRPE